LGVHPEDDAGVGADLVGVVRQLDAAGLAPAAHLHLGLHHDGVAGFVGLGHRLVDGVGHAPGRHGDVEAGEVLLALVLEEVHYATSSRSSSVSPSHLQMPANDEPGVKTSATPMPFNVAMSSFGMTPPPNR